MSAVKLGMPIDNIMEIPGYVLGVGGSVAVGILLGKREREKANRVFSSTLAVSFLCGIGFALLSITSLTLAKILTGGSDLTADVSRFVFVTLLGAPIISLALQFINYVSVDNNPNLASAYVIVSNVVNLVLDYLLLKYTPLGTAGAALSTVLGYGLAMLVLIFYFRSPKRMLHLVNPFQHTKSAFLLALSTGLPTLLYMIFITIKDFGLNTLIVRQIGTDAMVVYTICANVVLLVELCIGGMMGTISSIGGVIYGEKDYFGLKSLVKRVLLYSYLTLGVAMVVLLLGTRYVVMLFGVRSGVLLGISITGLRLFVFCLPFYLWNNFLTTYYQNIEQTKLSGLVTSLQNCLVILPIAALFVFGAKALGLDRLNALMLSFVVAEALTALIVWIVRKIKYPKEGVLLLPAQEDENVLDLSIEGNLKEAEKVPHLILEFCKEKGVEARKANLLAVAAEEMLVNIIRYGGHGTDTLDINLCLTKSALLFRIRDNGIPFDPTDYPQDAEDFNIHGIEVVKRITDKIQYMRVLDLNNTILEIGLD
ncbi:MAG: ATP-binding protein [Allobaculum sp.]|nr:ATP-binding protein [Allobaculum sp.]